MAADGGQRYELGRLVLEYLRTFMWPLVVVAFGIFYWDDLQELVKGREVNIFGVEIGPAVAQLQERTEQELVDLQALVADLKASYRRELEAALAGQRPSSTSAEAPVSAQTREAAQAVEAKLSSLRANLDREAQALREVTVQQALPQQPTPPGDALQPPPPGNVPDARAEQAAAFERAGFQAILDRRSTTPSRPSVARARPGPTTTTSPRLPTIWLRPKPPQVRSTMRAEPGSIGPF
jgi:hypothetical protein